MLLRSLSFVKSPKNSSLTDTLKLKYIMSSGNYFVSPITYVFYVFLIPTLKQQCRLHMFEKRN
jgi:hypothetical protein